MQYPGLPDLYSLSDASNFTLTVTPFLYQLPDNLGDLLRGDLSPTRFLQQSNPLVLCLLLCGAWSALSLLLSWTTGNYSWMDRFWSLVPTSHATLILTRAYATPTEEGRNGHLHARLVVVWCMQVLWSVRLTRNYYRKGGYARGSEDYRWEFVRNYLKSPVLFELLNVLFISLVQNLLLMAISAPPTYVVMLVGNERPLGPADVLALEVLIFSLAGQLWSDDLQLRYQTCKKKHAKGTATLDDTYREFSIVQLERGFVTTAGWKWSRHPAFFLEQVFWITVWLWAATTTGEGLFNYTACGAFGYIALFQVSTRLTEYISANKYPAYKRYQRKVGMLCPVPFWSWDEGAESAIESQQQQRGREKQAIKKDE